MDSEDTRPRISSFLLLRKKLERGQSLIWATEEQISRFRRHLPGFMALDSGHIPSSNGYCHIPASVLEKAFELYDLQQAQAQATEINRSVILWLIRLEGLTLRMSFGNECVQFVPKQSFIRAQLRRVTALSVKQVKIWMTPCWRPGNFGLKTRWLMIRNGITYCNVMLML